MYEHSMTTHITMTVDVSYDILNNKYYSEL